MRLSYVLLVVAAALVSVLDATAATTGNTVANPGMAKAAFAPENNGRRSLRLVQDDDEDESSDVDDEDDESDDDDEQEERMWGALSKLKQAAEDKMALTAVASNFVGKSTDEMGEVLKKLTQAQINTIFDQGEDSIQKILPGFKTGMKFEKFDDLIRGLPQEQQGVMMVAYTKYLDGKGLLK
ncbi:hypothetical protein P3T76_008879 [Phytophthora citrophthora]|uniref:RxLR effector protein n=1 Tax=Phytophthora citrophthora TaxID=4793 RepID=A0AAD9GHY8_9STRA|nr:hypothetical protein P3T76_008874 [Phytophthora citrophthora]KAK1938801.1 hypothetical protein P3T76_008876 [Phytophthora citrophthora]KAK1938802.1 hypothetical protein P3T76_008877 [Phytophthora citrophthora]KAK1938804.1 hypothetical protein P3T76_008879 [Phytophthora citrophthora]